MAVSRALLRLLRIRNLQEEQSRLALESSAGALTQLEDAMQASAGQNRRGRLLVDASARNGEFLDRLSGLEESRTAERIGTVLAPRIHMKKLEVNTRREEFQAVRVARKQAESLIAAAESLDALETGRQSQRALDDWYSSRIHKVRSCERHARDSSNDGAVDGESRGDVKPSGELKKWDEGLP